jgi:uncharacterized membrane protein YjfL (UPF0719 family)
MSGDEIFALIGSVVLGIVGWKTWLGGLFFLSGLSRKPATQLLGWLTPLVGGLVLFFVLCNWSSHDVRDNAVYIFFYMMMGFGWAGLWNWILPYLGLSFRDDALERDNDAAGLAICGSLLGTVFAFAGANIGDGPGWWVVVFCAALAGITMILLWMIGSQVSRVQEFITVDRDVAAGWRVAGFFVGSGLILGRAVAGDWHSAQITVFDFIAKGWPVLILWAVALLLDLASKPTPQRPVPNPIAFGVFPGVFLAGLGVVEVLLRGPW